MLWCEYSILLLYTVNLVIFARFKFSRISRVGQIQESRENYYYNSTTKEISNFVKSPKIRNSRNSNARKLPDVQYYDKLWHSCGISTWQWNIFPYCTCIFSYALVKKCIDSIQIDRLTTVFN